MRLEDVHPDSRALVQEIIDIEDVKCVQVSCFSEEGVMDLKNKACDALLAHRVDAKLKGTKINSVINRIHVAQPKARDEVVRAPFIPEVVREKKKYDKNDPERKRLAKDIELEEGGPGVYNINMKRESLLLWFCTFSHNFRYRGLPARQPRVEDGHHARDHGWQEHLRLHRSRYRRETRSA